MGIPEGVPRELLDATYERAMSGAGFPAGHLLGELATDEARKEDIANSFMLFREVIQEKLLSMGVDDSDVTDFVTMYAAFQERRGFESGVHFVYDNAHVTSRGEAARRSSVLHNMKLAGTMGVD